MKARLTTVTAAAAALAATSLILSTARAQPPYPPASDASTIAPTHGDWTLRQREDWLYDRLDKARDDGSVDKVEAERVKHEINSIRDDERRMRDHHDGQLTDNENNALEARLDQVADKIHWLHEDSFRRPW